MAVEIIFKDGGAERLFREKLPGERRHVFQRRLHRPYGISRLNYVHIVAEHLDGGAFVVHSGDPRDAEKLLSLFDDVAAGEAVSSGVEGGAGDDEIRLFPRQHLGEIREDLVRMLGEIIVSADVGHGDVGLAAEKLF
ncbi:hypothetical protein SDC9_176611 [bioreactor metagenome]|uniref:Uncharacterized protein n=1 Tax=bioreactor metagenome TaxID=1076179 RepID=A0A645GSB0_9ZZZZ